MNIWRLLTLKWLMVMALVAVLAAALAWRELSTPQSNTAESPSVEVELGNLQQQVLASGVVQPRLKVDVSAQVSGQVLTLHVKPGDAVAEGDLLVSLNPELARNEVAQARANVAQQQASMASRQVDESLAQREAARQRTLMKGQATSAMELEKAEAELLKIQRDIEGLQATLGKQ